LIHFYKRILFKMAVPTPESLAMNCEMKCDMCKESVNYGDDYRTHLQFAHSVTNNFPFFMNKALEKLKLETRKAVDIVTLEEEVSDVTEQSLVSNKKVSRPDVLDEETKKQIEKTIEKTMDELFAPIRSLLEGKEPIEPLDDEINGDLGDDPYAYDENIWQCFENLKDKVNNMEFPIEFLQELSSTKASDESPVIPSKDIMDEIDSPAPTVTKEEPVKKFRKPQVKRRAESPLVKDKKSLKATRVNQNQSTFETPVSKSDVTHTKSTKSPAGGAKNIPPEKLAPVRSDQSDRSTNSEAGKVKTFFICPLETCSFYTSKQGMVGGKAANHLKEAHKISGEDYKAAGPGVFKFKKVKGEPKA